MLSTKARAASSRKNKALRKLALSKPGRRKRAQRRHARSRHLINKPSDSNPHPVSRGLPKPDPLPLMPPRRHRTHKNPNPGALNRQPLAPPHRLSSNTQPSKPGNKRPLRPNLSALANKPRPGNNNAAGKDPAPGRDALPGNSMFHSTGLPITAPGHSVAATADT